MNRKHIGLILFLLIMIFTLPGISGADDEHIGGVKGLSKKMTKIETAMEKLKGIEKWFNKVTFSGTVEIEAGYGKIDFDDPFDDLAEKDEESSDLALATAELGIDADIAKHVKGHVLYMWEEDDSAVDLDEGFIMIDGEDKVPLYLNAGKLYVPFGYFNSHFICDPLTLELGETRESAIVIGGGNDWLDLCLGTFNGDIDETDDDDHINSFVASGIFTLPKDAVQGLRLTTGMSWISNIADSDGLQGEDGVDGDAVNDSVGGFSAFISVSLIDRIFLEAEYLGAIDAFEAGALAFDGGEAFKPETWNFEIAYAATENLEIGAKYEGSHDCGSYLPEKQYGCVAAYQLFENTSLAVEYLHGEFENNDEQDLATAQLAIAF